MKKSDKGKKVWGLIVFFGVMAIASLFIGAISAAAAEAIIIDTEKGVPGFRTEPARDLPGNWQYVHDHPDTSADGWFDTNAYPPGQGNGSFWYTISFPDMGECKGIWETSVPYTGKYEVFAWLPSPDSFDPYLDESTPPSDYLPTKRAQYKVFHNDGVATVTIDQNVNMGRLTSLGVFVFDSTARVELSSNGVEFWRSVAFDAVKFVPIVHDMAVTDVSIMPPLTSVGQSTAICVTVTNAGSQQEDNVSVKAFVDGAQVDSTMYVSLDPGASDTMAFLWVPRAAKNYSVEGEVGIVSGEMDTEDNTKAVEVEVPAMPAPAPISDEESGDRRLNGTTQAIRQEFVWDDDTGTFQTFNLYVIGNVSDYIANMTEILQRGASDEPHGSHTITKVGENPLNYRYWNCSQSQWLTLPNVNRYEGQNSSVEGVIDRYDRYYYNNCSGENRVASYTPRINISLANGWNISVNASYTDCGHEIWFIAPDGNISYLYGDPHLLQAHGTQQQELAALGEYVFALDENYILNASCMKSHAGFSVVTNITITGPNNYTVTIGRNSEVKVSGGTSASDVTPPHIHFFTYPLESTSNNYARISINGSEPLNSALLEWNGINETMQGSGRDWYINKTNLGSTYIYKVYGNDSNGNWGVTEEKQVEIKTLAPPNITSFSPPSPVNDTVCTWRTFNVTVNQTVNASWYLNGTLQFTNESAREASCRLHANVTGVHNVTAIASNANGTDMQTWVWNVTPRRINCTCGDICVNTSGWWRDDAAFNPADTPIQSAVDNATAGDTICVKNGTYTENVDVNMRLTIKSENGAATTIVNASDSNDSVFNVSCDYVNISGFTATGGSVAGIYLGNGVDHCYISDNKVTNNSIGISLSMSSNNTIANNIIGNNSWGIILTSYSNPPFSDNNTIENNTIVKNKDGIWLFSAANNTVKNNTITGNTNFGLSIWFFTGYSTHRADDNLIYNNYFNNTNNTFDNQNNIWNTVKTGGTNIIGGPYLGGNYWSDYEGLDTDGDGLGDTLLPYNSSGAITNGGDWHPLVHVSVSPTKIIYPDFTDTDTPGNWRTWIGVMNTGDASTTLNLTIYSQDGSLAYSNPDFVTLEPKAAHFFRPGITAGIAQGSTIVYGDNLAGTCHESKNDGDGAKVYTAVTSSSPTLYYPDFTDTDTIGNWRTWMGVVNAGDTSTTLRLDVYNPDGSLAYSNANFVTLEPKAAHFFRPGITAGIAQGCVVVSGANLAGTCHVNKNGGEGTKVYTALTSGSSTLYYPDFTDTDTIGNWRTWLGVMNTGDTSTTLNLTIYNPDGSLAYFDANFITLEPKAAHFFRPGITAGIAQGDVVVSGDNLAGTCHVNKNGGVSTKVYTALASGSSTLNYPDFTDTDTTGNWRTWMGVMNTGATSTTVRLDVYNADGSLAYSNANFVTLEPKATHFFRPGITAGIAQGDVVVSGDSLAGTCHVNKNGGVGTKVYTAIGG